MYKLDICFRMIGVQFMNCPNCNSENIERKEYPELKYNFETDECEEEYIDRFYWCKNCGVTFY